MPPLPACLQRDWPRAEHRLSRLDGAQATVAKAQTWLGLPHTVSAPCHPRKHTVTSSYICPDCITSLPRLLPPPHLCLPAFPPSAEYQSWEKVDPATLFDAPTLKAEANPKARVCRHLQVRCQAGCPVPTSPADLGGTTGSVSPGEPGCVSRGVCAWYQTCPVIWEAHKSSTFKLMVRPPKPTHEQRG